MMVSEDSLGSQHGTLPLTGWSSLIGIVTAIVGNILISFALNIQRYAHVLISREHDDRRNGWGSHKGKRSVGDYGTGLSGQARTPSSQNIEFATDEEATESHPLMAAQAPEPDDRSSGDESSDVEKGEAEGGKKTYLRSPYWWAGVMLMTVGEAGNFLAYGFAPASIVSPLGVVALVSNCVIAPIMLHERFRRRDFAGVVIAIAGAVTVVLSARPSEKRLGPDEIIDAITRWEFELYLAITVLLILLGMWGSRRYGERTILIDLGLVALFGGYTALSTKGVATLLSYTWWHVLTFPITYLLLAILVSTAGLQIKYVNRALQRFDSTQVIPTQFVLFTISVIVGSAILYRDFEQADAARLLKFLFGCALTFLAVYLITSGRDRDEAGDDEVAENGVEQALDVATSSRPEEPLHRPVEDGGHRQANDRSVGDRQVRSRSDTVSSDEGLHRPDAASNAPSIAFSSDVVSQSSVTSSQLPLHENPWRSELERPSLALAQGSNQTTAMSSPLLPAEAHAHTEAGPADHPIGTHHLARPSSSTLGRQSIARMLPGPYVAPLSSSLSAVVADSLRRGTPTSPSIRRRSNRSRESLRQAAATLPRMRSHSVRDRPRLEQAAGDHLSGDITPDDDQPEASREAEGLNSTMKGMAKNLTSSLGTLLRGRRRGRSDNEIER